MHVWYLYKCIFSLYLKFGVGIKHDVFNGALDVLSPAGQPCHSVVMSNLLPVVTSRWHRDTGFSANEREGVQKMTAC